MLTAASILIVLTLASGVYFLRHRSLLLLLFVLLSISPLFFGSPTLALILSTLLLALLLAQPLYVLLGAVTLVCMHAVPDNHLVHYSIFPEKIFELADKNVLLAIPFFVVSGNIMAQGGIASSLVNVARALTRWLPGGLAISAIGGCILFAAISGSSPVTVIAIGGMMYPSLLKAGFGERDSIGLLTSAGSLGIVIPPSIPMIIYGIVVSGRQVIDVGDLFLAGLGPGLLIGGLLTLYVVAKSLKKSTTPAADIQRLAKGLGIALLPGIFTLTVSNMVPAFGGWAWIMAILLYLGLAVWVAGPALWQGFWALLLPVLILGGIYGSLFTPTQAAAVSVVYALVVAIYIERKLTWKRVPHLFVGSTIMMGTLIIIMVLSFVFNDFLVNEQIPDKAVAFIKHLGLGRLGFLLALNIFLLVVGCFMDIISAILIIAPLVVPMAMAPGIEIDPIHLGIIFIVNLEIGYLTPPLGLNLFVASTLFHKPLGDVVKGVLPYMAIILVGVLAITYIPAISLGLGRLLQPAPFAATEAPTKELPHKRPGKVLSIEELMRRTDTQSTDPTEKSAQDTHETHDNTRVKRIKSIEELMRDADNKDTNPELLQHETHTPSPKHHQ